MASNRYNPDRALGFATLDTIQNNLNDINDILGTLQGMSDIDDPEVNADGVQRIIMHSRIIALILLNSMEICGTDLEALKDVEKEARDLSHQVNEILDRLEKKIGAIKKAASNR